LSGGWLKLFIGVLISLILFNFPVAAKDPFIAVGQPAPTFSLPNIDQKYVSLRDLCGKELRKPWKNKIKHVVVLSFFATWCKPCIAEIPHLESLEKQFKDQPVKFFLIDVGEEREKVKDFKNKKDISLNILLDRYQKTATKYDALTLPRLVVVDKEGVIQKEQKGFSDPEAFETELKNLITKLLN
jgi:thiol-disulfide isomerase/thioredoxin